MNDTSTVLGRGTRGAVRRVLVVMLDEAVATHELPAAGELVIGRAQTADLRIDHRSVSRAHAAIELGDAVRVRDLGSANGTALRGARLPPNRAVEVGANEAFQIGDATVVVQERRGLAQGLPRASGEGSATAIAPAPIVLDAGMRNLFDLARRVAAGTIGVLVIGESGAGKDVLARAIHEASPRARGPFVAINCAAISESLIESELFGHERGAFTGAAAPKPGLFEAASGGTVFLDEVGELSAGAQAKLLRVLEDRRVLRVGATEPRAVDVRFVAATNRDLEADAGGRFRKDLYFRLAGIVLDVPPLRERRAEIEPLARAFVTASAAQLGRPVPELSPDAIAALVAHPWPGNVRELRNVMERAVLLARDRISAVELFGSARSRAATPALGSPAADGERERIVAALDRCAGNQTRAAELLDMPRRTLVKRLAQYGIPRPKRG